MRLIPAWLAFAASTGAAALCLRETCPAESATSLALTYGQPLLAFYQAYRSAEVNGATVTTNSLVAKTALATPEDTAVVATNVDTLYSSMMFDVSRQDVELVVGEVDDGRYYGLALYTPYGENFVTFGATTGATPGTYLLTAATSLNTSGTMQPDPSGRYQGVVHAPSTFGTLLVRFELKNTEDDISVVNEIQKGFNATGVDRSGESIGPELTASIFDNSSNSQLEYIMDLTARFTQAVPETVGGPIIPANTTAMLRAAGICPEDGTYQEPDCVNLTKAYIVSEAAVGVAYQSNETNIDLGNYWRTPKPGYIGTYGTHYAGRASVARWGYLAMTEDETLYPSYTQTFSLQANESYSLQFVGKPPIKDIGFWSVTAYDASGYLTDNAIGRYSVGDRSNLTYPDGTLVYGSDVNSTFEVLVQAAQPPDTYYSNWLPSPSQPGDFTMLLRFYAPDDTLQNGAYTFPDVVKQAAVTGNTTVTY